MLPSRAARGPPGTPVSLCPLTWLPWWRLFDFHLNQNNEQIKSPHKKKDTKYLAFLERWDLANQNPKTTLAVTGWSWVQVEHSGWGLGHPAHHSILDNEDQSRPASVIMLVLLLSLLQRKASVFTRVCVKSGNGNYTGRALRWVGERGRARLGRNTSLKKWERSQ